MDKNLFLKNMEEMIQIAKTNGNQIDHKELLDYFSDYELNEEAKKLLIASFVGFAFWVLMKHRSLQKKRRKKKLTFRKKNRVRSDSMKKN